MTLKRAISIDELEKRVFKIMDFKNEFLASFGTPEMTGVWIIWGNSGNGKTRFALQLLKYLTKFAKKVAYDTLEEGARFSFQKASKETNLREVKSRVLILDVESIEDLKERLRKPKSPDIVFLDSFQYTGMSKSDYKKLKSEFRKKLFIFISHAEGKHPEGRPAKFVRYDADIKIRIEGYKAFPTSRFGGGEPFIIWDKGAQEYWAEIN